MSYFRAHIDAMAGYVPGEQPQEGQYIKLNTNENPYPPSPKVLQALREACNEDIRRYPDPMADRIRDKAAALFGLQRKQILVGNGSDDLLTIVTRSFAGEGDRVVYPYPTYTLYKTLAQIQNARPVEIDFTEDYGLPDEILVQGARIIFLANPNSPSGTVVPAERIAEVAQRTKGVVVVDEAYVDFTEGDCVGLIHEYDNVMVLRTFSKSFSLAGMRIGIAMASEELIEGMVKVKDSYNVNRLSIVAGEAALEDIAHMRANAEKIRATRAYLTKGLSALGFHVYPSHSNFVLARIAHPEARYLYEKLKRRKILVRYFNQRRLEDCLRITVGTDAEINRLLIELRDLCSR